MEISPETFASLWLVFLGGLAGSAHCLGMCGPLLALAESVRPGKWQVWSQLPLHLGRLITYSILGALAGLLGAAIKAGGMTMGIQGIASIVGGVIMIIFALSLLGWLPLPMIVNVSKGFTRVFSEKLSADKPFGGFTIGLYWGLLPCGLTWAWVLGAGTATAHPLEASLVMFVFGAGTVPALLVIGGLGGILGRTARNWLNRFGAVTVILMGVILILRGAARLGLIGKIMLAPGVPLY
jgi:sulfite exporter TauE/SafE